MAEKKRVTFKDSVNKDFEDRVRDIAKKTLADEKEEEKKKSVNEKLEAIRKTLAPQAIPKVTTEEAGGVAGHVHTHEVENGNDCPTCSAKGNKHTIKIVGKVAKCTGPNCGTEYLLEMKPKIVSKEKRKDLVCTTCGHSTTEEEMKGQETCPLCNIGKQMMKINYTDYDSGKLEKTRVL